MPALLARVARGRFCRWPCRYLRSLRRHGRAHRRSALTASVVLRLGLGIGVLVALLDQGAKSWVLATVMQPPRVIEVTSFFNLVLGWNRGVSFGLLNDADGVGPWPFLALTAAITLGLGFWLYRVSGRWLGVALGLIIGGAVGNAADRVRFGAVVDFLDFHLAGLHWPAFNLADSAISVGVVMILVDSLFGHSRSPTI